MPIGVFDEGVISTLITSKRGSDGESQLNTNTEADKARNLNFIIGFVRKILANVKLAYQG